MTGPVTHNADDTHDGGKVKVSTVSYQENTLEVKIYLLTWIEYGGSLRSPGCQAIKWLLFKIR